MKNIFHLLLLFLCVFQISSFARAEAILGLDYMLFTDKSTVEANTSTTSSKSMYLINVQFGVGQKKSFFIGWALYNVGTKDEVNLGKSNYSTQDMGPSFRYQFGHGGLYFVNFVYGIQTKTAYDSGGTADSWLGTNYLLQFGVSPEISESFSVSFAYNMFTGAAKTKVVSSVQTDVSYSKALMAPTLGLIYKW